MVSGLAANADPLSVLQLLKDIIEKAFGRNRVLVQSGHTRSHFGAQRIHSKCHIDPAVDPDKLSLAVALHQRNTELQQT